MSLNKYKLIDFSVFCVILVVLEAVNAIALSTFTGEIFTLSLALPIALIVMMRWNYLGIFVAMLGGIAYCFFLEGDFSHYIIYTAGNGFIGLNLLWFVFIKDKNKIAKDTLLTILFVVSGYLAISLGRSIFSTIFFHDLLANLNQHFFKDLLNAVITIVIVLIAKRQNGIFEDQILYLKRIQRENKKDDN